MYKSDTQSSAQFAINPFQRVEIPLCYKSLSATNGVDRSSGEFFPSMEGTSIYIERCDYPVLISLVSPAGGLQQSFVARDGLRIDGNFKGLYLRHPRVNFYQGAASLSLIVSKGNGASVDNGFQNPCGIYNLPGRTIVNTDTLITREYLLPEGMRFLSALQALATGSTCANMKIYFADLSGYAQQIRGPSIVDADTGISYSCDGYEQYLSSPYATLTGAAYAASCVGMKIPSNAKFLTISAVGTGLTGLAVTMANLQ